MLTLTSPAMRKFTWLASLMTIVSLASACEDTRNPVDTGPAFSVAPGVYDLSTMTSIDPTFAGFTTLAHAAVLTIEHSPTDKSMLTGRFTEFREIVDGQQTACCASGTLSGVVDRTGRVTVELKWPDGTVYWIGTGLIVETRIEGKWRGRWTTGELTGDLGPFTAELRKNP